MRLAVFHLMPWPYLPEDFLSSESSAWVTYSNKNFDPEKGRELYERYLGELAYGEELGFDAICVNEHHQTAYGLMPCPNLVAMALIHRTSHVKIAILGNAIPLRDHPLRVAEEVAMLDVVSGGRIICGIVRGIGQEYYTFGINPTQSAERFHEAHDLLVAAWTKPGPFPWHSKHYHIPYVNPWPRPLQDPHPPIWIPTQGSTSTLRWAAQQRYAIFQTFAPLENIIKGGIQYTQFAREFGYEVDPRQLGWTFPIYVGKDDETALEEFTPHCEYYYHQLIHRPPRSLFPPGYVDRASFARIYAARGAIGSERPTAKKLNDRSEIIVGGPNTVLERLRVAADAGGIGTLAPLFQTGTMPHDLTVASMERFAEQVMPKLKDYLPDPPAAEPTRA